MAFFMQEEVRARARVRARHEGLTIEESLAQIAGKQADIYDIFLSQTIRDAEIVLGGGRPPLRNGFHRIL